MPCESCAVQFSVFRRKRACAECERYYCSGCLRRGGGTMCAACRVLSTRPLARHSLTHLKVRDLQFFLQRQNVSTRGCVEKEDLVNLVVSHANNSAPRRRAPPRPPAPDFTHTFSTSIKGFTNNINSFINSAFDIRPQPTPAPPPPSCYNSTHSHGTGGAPTPAGGVPSSSGHTAHTAQAAAPPTAPSAPARPRARPNQSPQQQSVETSVSEPGSSEEQSEHRDTADCLEIEDLDDTAEWEFVNPPARPLPTDSNVLIADNNNELTGASSLGARAASELDLRGARAADTATDTSSLQDEPYTLPEPSLPKRIRLEDLKALSDLDDLNVKQLKELLVLNRVDFKGCVERNELLERAKRLWRESTKSREDMNKLSMEESCKICMDAPVECVLLECGHIAACTACSKRLSECPICRQYVVRVVRFFRS